MIFTTTKPSPIHDPSGFTPWEKWFALIPVVIDYNEETRKQTWIWMGWYEVRSIPPANPDYGYYHIERRLPGSDKVYILDERANCQARS